MGTDWVSRFSYDYQDEQWSHLGWSGGQTTLGGVISINDLAFMGAGGPHEVDAGTWWYSYEYGDDRGQWFRSDDDAFIRFSYAYATGIWSHHDWNGGQDVLSVPLSLSDMTFIGVDGWHVVSSVPWYYHYDYGTDVGAWSQVSDGSIQRFSYDYLNGQWYLFGPYSIGSAPLGSSGTWLTLGSFMGDGYRHQLTYGGDEWWFKYSSLYQESAWYLADDDVTARFFYQNSIGIWSFADGHGNQMGDLTSLNWTPDFIGDGLRHQVVLGFLTTWKVIYNYTADEMRIIHNDELDDNTWNYIGFSFAGEYSWYDSYTDGAVQASYQLDSYRYMWCLDTSVTFRNHVDGYTMDYSLAGGAADRYARYWETATGINYSKYVYATGWWWGWDGSDFNEDWGPGASNLYRVPGGE